LTIPHSTIAGNREIGGSGGAGGAGDFARGGGINNARGGNLVISYSSISDNQAVGGAGGAGGNGSFAQGGGIHNGELESQLAVTHTTFRKNWGPWRGGRRGG